MPMLSRWPGKDVQPQTPPTLNELEKASKIFTQQLLAAYQRLYRVGLTTAGTVEHPGSPFHVQRSLAHQHCLEVIPYRYPQWKFLVRTAEEIEGVVEKATQLFDAINAGQPLCDFRACCPCAERQPCVCIISFRCPLHGARCYGSHD